MTRRIHLHREVQLADGKTPPSRFLICSKGTTETSKGPYIFSDDSAASAMKEFKKRGVKGAIDYGHSMLRSSWSPGDPAAMGAAAGRYELSLDSNGDLYADKVAWTPRATQMLADGEYAYISPVLDLAEDGSVVAVWNCALTNIPATYGAEPLISLSDDHPSPERRPMKNFGPIATLLSLSAESPDETVMTRVVELQSGAASLLELTDSKSSGEALGKLRAWKDAAAKLVVLQAETEKASKARVALEVDALITDAEKAKKVVPAQREALKQIGLSDVEQLKAFLGAAVPIMTAVKEPADGTNVNTGATMALSDTEKEVAKLMGTSEKEYAEHKAKVGDVRYATNQRT